MNQLPYGNNFIAGEVDLFSDVLPISLLAMRDRDAMLYACVTELEALYVDYQNFRKAWSDFKNNVDGSDYDRVFDPKIEAERRRLRGRFFDFFAATSKYDDPSHANGFNHALSDLRSFNDAHPAYKKRITLDEIHAMRMANDDRWDIAARIFFKDEKIIARIYALKRALDDALERHDYPYVASYIQTRIFHHTVHTPAQDLLVDLVFSKIGHIANDLDKMPYFDLDKILLPVVHEVLLALNDESFNPDDSSCVHVFTTQSIFKAILISDLAPA